MQVVTVVVEVMAIVVDGVIVVVGMGLKLGLFIISLYAILGYLVELYFSALVIVAFKTVLY